MNPSRLFILRPVATSLLMAAILLAGLVAYRQLPVSALPEVDYPTIQVLTFYPGASPDVMASSVTAPLERQFGQVPGLNQMTSNSSFGSSVITLQFVLDLNIDVAEQEVQAAINAASTYLPADLPNPPIYSKTNPADAPILTLALDLDRASADPGGGFGGHAAGPEDFAGPRRWTGEHQRRAEAGGARPGQPDGAGLLWPEPGGPAQRARGGQRRPGQGQLRRPAAGLHHRRQRPVAYERGLSAAGRRLSQRRAGAAVGRRAGHRRRGKRQAGGLDEQRARGDPQHPAAARRQHHHGGGSDQGAAAAAAELAAGIGEGCSAHGPHHHHPRLGAGRGVRADAHRSRWW